ncbi:hypothetical protein GPJ56_004399 [Histomonas meleagridis]|uniref:uncharacterized protein n=1 Tax=Histomonas meleagridis TaxID=135588 RepID=UPI003559FEA3|nr:hypothetical protein GPJ56_004399 [Histomonas meleagridis]KAH0799957.1 hypothetical protein GO595_007069 [Histomonas meleagridis]
MYDYTLQVHENIIDVCFPIVEGVSPDKISIENDNSNSEIICKLENHIPFFAGQLAKPAESIQTFIRDGNYVIQLKGISINEPKIVINGPTKANIIDPRSAFLASMLYYDNDSLSNRYLDIALSFNYTKAICWKCRKLIYDESSQEEGYQLLKKIFDIYHDEDTSLLIGLYLLQTDVQSSIKYFEISYSQGNNEAGIAIAEIYSPYSTVVYEHKDPQKSLKILEKVHEEMRENPFVCYDLAQFYEKGEYVKKDIEKAEEMREFAISLVPELGKNDTLCAKKEEGNSRLCKTLAIVAGSVLVIGIGIAVYRRFRRK